MQPSTSYSPPILVPILVHTVSYKGLFRGQPHVCLGILSSQIQALWHCLFLYHKDFRTWAPVQGSTEELWVMMRRDGGMAGERDSGWTGLEVLARGRGL